MAQVGRNLVREPARIGRCADDDKRISGKVKYCFTLCRGIQRDETEGDTERLSGLHGSSSPAVALVTYGNRAYENALAELFRVLTDGGMKPTAGAVCVCQHSIARALAAGRPNAEDCAEVRRFAAKAAERIQKDEIVLSPAVPGDADSSYYIPTGTSGKPEIGRGVRVVPVGLKYSPMTEDMRMAFTSFFKDK